MTRLLSCLLCVPLAAPCGCGASSTEPAPAPAQPPLARLWIPRLASPATALTLDASGSQSPGGALTHFRFSYGDAGAQVDSGAPRVQHAWANEGVYAVAVEVEDLAGRTARAQGVLTIRAAAPSCTADLDCTAAAGDACRDGLCCTLTGSTP